MDSKKKFKNLPNYSKINKENKSFIEGFLGYYKNSQ